MVFGVIILVGGVHMAKFCPNCGKEVRETDNNCSNCGQPLKINNYNNTNNNYSNNTNQRSKIAAGILGIFLGAFGIHNFYLGYNGKALGQLLLTVLSCGVLSFVSVIWGLVEGIMILTGSISVDADGVRLKD